MHKVDTRIKCIIRHALCTRQSQDCFEITRYICVLFYYVTLQHNQLKEYRSPMYNTINEINDHSLENYNLTEGKQFLHTVICC